MNKRLRELRKDILKLSQKEFADKLQITQAGLSKIELGGSILTERNIKTICEKFNINEEWLRNGIEPVFINDYSHMNINERLRKLRKDILNLSQKKFGESIGLKQSSINDIESGKNSLKENNLKLICQTFNVNEEWLRNGVGDIFKENNKEKSLIDIIEEEYNLSTLSKSIIDKYLKLGKKEQAMFEKFVIELFEEYKISSNENNITQIPKYTLEEENSVDDELSITELDEIKLYDLPVSAGTGIQLLDDVSYELITIDRRFYPRADFALRVSGDSMEPRFYDGDIIYIKSENCLDNGQIGIFYYNDEAYLKKLEKENGKISLISLNEKYPPIEVTNDSFKAVGIVL